MQFELVAGNVKLSCGILLRIMIYKKSKQVFYIINVLCDLMGTELRIICGHVVSISNSTITYGSWIGSKIDSSSYQLQYIYIYMWMII